MKTLRLVGRCAMAVFVAASLTACEDDDNDADEVVLDDYSALAQEWDNNGAWAKTYHVNVGEFLLDGFTFSHEASGYEWGGVTYYSWKGFAPSRSTDNADHSGDDWIQYQWGAITGGGMSGAGSPYILACYDVQEDLTSVPTNPSLAITFGNVVFDAEEVFVTNSAYGHYGMKNGTAYSKQWTSSDWFKLHIIGTRGGVETGRVEVLLADGLNILDSWKRVDLDPLGDVDMIYFQLSSSDSGQWGMNNPGYFCLDRIKVELPN